MKEAVREKKNCHILKDAWSLAGKNKGCTEVVIIFAFTEQSLCAPRSLTEGFSLRIHLRPAGVRQGLPASLYISGEIALRWTD